MAFSFVTPLIAFLLALVAAYGVLGKGGLAASLRRIPGGKLTLVGLVAVLVIFAGAIAGASQLWGKVAGSAATASLVSSSSDEVAGQTQASWIDYCTVGAISGVGNGLNLTFHADTGNLQHYYVDVKSDAGTPSASINGSLLCNRKTTSDLAIGASTVCYAKADSFRSEVSTSDANTYYIVSTSTTASKVRGYQWAQTIYLKDGSVAATTDDQEQTYFAIARDVSQDTLGFRFALPGSDYLKMNNQTAKNVNIFCGDQQVYSITMNKVA